MKYTYFVWRFIWTTLWSGPLTAEYTEHATYNIFLSITCGRLLTMHYTRWLWHKQARSLTARCDAVYYLANTAPGRNHSSASTSISSNSWIFHKSHCNLLFSPNSLRLHYICSLFSVLNYTWTFTVRSAHTCTEFFVVLHTVNF